jgi:hypothetical protein
MGLSKKAAKAKQITVKKSILQWCKDQTDQGNELKILWDGGGDSGWAHFQINGEDVDNEYTEALVDIIYNTLDYGSWAGEFSAQGEAIYNPKTNSFEGTDYYSEEQSEAIESDITIRIPKEFWFDSLHVECECYHEEAPNLSARFIIKNGFLTNQHLDFCRNLQESLRDNFDELFDNYHSAKDDFRGCNDSWILERSEAKEENGELIFKIENVDIQVDYTIDKDIVLELDEETVETINHILNHTEDES